MTFLFAFSYNSKTGEANFAGNLGIQEALQILQQLAIADAVRKARETDKQQEADKQLGEVDGQIKEESRE